MAARWQAGPVIIGRGWQGKRDRRCILRSGVVEAERQAEAEGATWAHPPRRMRTRMGKVNGVRDWRLAAGGVTRRA